MTEFKSLTQLDPSLTLGGRPEHLPTDQTRALVTLMAGMGANETDISHVIGISRNTLRKHYGPELASGPAKMDYHVYGAMYKAISRGKTDMIKLYLERRKGWKEEKQDINVAVSVSVTMEDILKEIDGQTTGLLDVNKKPLVIEHERKPDAPTIQSSSVLPQPAGQAGDGESSDG
jgi:hypothetical protein